MIPDTVQDLDTLKAMLNQQLASISARLNKLDRGQGKVRLLASMDANGYPIENLPSSQRDPNNAITKNEVLSAILLSDAEGISLLWSYFLS